ncbi:hypothetical protein LINPERPRIM_LOCUS38977 [Linum perenne]
MNSAADSGIIRDDQGYFVQAFFANLGTYSIMRAELRGIIEGMEIALSNGIKKLRILLDSRAEHSYHIYPDANFFVNYLANLGHNLKLNICLLAMIQPYWRIYASLVSNNMQRLTPIPKRKA